MPVFKEGSWGSHWVNQEDSEPHQQHSQGCSSISRSMVASKAIYFKINCVLTSSHHYPLINHAQLRTPSSTNYNQDAQHPRGSFRCRNTKVPSKRTQKLWPQRAEPLAAFPTTAQRKYQAGACGQRVHFQMKELSALELWPHFRKHPTCSWLWQSRKAYKVTFQLGCYHRKIMRNWPPYL